MSPKRRIPAALVGGAAASFAMDVVQALLAARFEQRRSKDDRDEEVEAIESVVRLIGTFVPTAALPGRAHVTARFLHYSFGIGFAYAYVLAVERSRAVAVGNGVAFGIALFIASDRILIPAFHLGRSWERYSRGERFNALASHVAYGVVLETIRSGVAGRTSD